MELKKTKIISTGMYVPQNIVTNFDLAKTIETSDEWIVERTGIKERRISNPDANEFPTDMALYATQQALEAAQLEPNDIDMIIFATVTPDVKLPNSASILQTKLGITNQCACLDIATACSGFVYGANMANSFIQTGMAKHVLVVGSEMLSREVDWEDRRVCILFGDGCGVGIFGPAQPTDQSEIISSCLGTDGRGREFFHQFHGGAVSPLTAEHIINREHFMQMKGTEMFKVATRTLAQNAKKVIEQAGMKLEDVDWIIPHQANLRIIETTAKILGAPLEKVVINISKYGNTSAATVPMAFHEAVLDGRIKRGDIVLFDAFGAGLTHGATLFRF